MKAGMPMERLGEYFDILIYECFIDAKGDEDVVRLDDNALR